MNSTEAGTQMEHIEVNWPKAPVVSREMTEPASKPTISIASGFGKSPGDSLVSEPGTMNLCPSAPLRSLSSGDESTVIEFNGRSSGKVTLAGSHSQILRKFLLPPQSCLIRCEFRQLLNCV
jgi:hypothetical protein